MQGKKMVLIIALFALAIIGWGVGIQASAGLKEKKEQAALVNQADTFMQKELYVRAIPLYEEAMTKYSTGREDEIENRLVDAYYQRGDMTAYNNLVKDRADRKVATEDEYIKSATNLLDSYSGKQAMELLRTGLNNMDSENIRNLYEDNRYAYSIRYTNFQEIMPVMSGFAPAYTGEYWCYIDNKGHMQRNTYEFVTRFNQDGLAVVKKNGKFYAINDNEEKYGIDELGVENVYDVAGNSVIAQKNGKYGFYDFDFGLKSESFQFDFISGLASGVYAVKSGDKWGVISQDAKVIVEPGTFSDIAINSVGTAYSYSVAMAKDDRGWFMINEKGERLNNAVFANAKAPESKEYIAVADNNGKWGFADSKGNVVINYQYDDAFSFSNGVAAVRNGNNWHYISAYNKQAIPLDFDNAQPFHNGVAFAYYGEGMSIIKLTYYVE